MRPAAAILAVGDDVPIAPELVEFLRSKFGSREQLDVFVLLQRTSDRDWSPAEVAAALGTAPQSAGMRLFLLASANLIAAGGSPDLRYRYLAEPALDVWASLIADAYAHDRQELYAAIGGTASPGQQFADAFDLRKP